MPTMVKQTPFIIIPENDLLKKNPQIKQLSADLANAYANNNVAISDDNLKVIGSVLWQALDKEDEFNQYLKTSANAIIPIIIQSNDPSIQQLPWEALYQKQHQFLGRNKRFSLSRNLTGIGSYTHSPSKGPLRILLFTAITEDQRRLDVEEEMANVQEALMPFITEGKVVLEMPDDGRFTSFQTFINDFQPHVLFMSGHGIFNGNDFNDKSAEAEFLFEAEQGMGSHAVNQQKIADALHGIPLECIMLSACQSGMGSSDSLNAGLMTHLASQGIPHIIGMRESIMDTAGIKFAQTFCTAISKGERVDIALQTARESISQPFKGAFRDLTDSSMDALSFGQWCLPALISHAPERPLIDWGFTAQVPTPIKNNGTLKSIHIPTRFIGRRQQLRELSARLQSNDYQQLLITGPGGQGKTALASKLLTNLQAQGKEAIVWSAREEYNWDDFQYEIEMLLDSNNTDRYYQKITARNDQASKIKLILRLLINQFPQGLVILFDNLESVQDPKTRELIDSSNTKSNTHFNRWIEQIQSLKADKLTLILTSRWKLPHWQSADHLSLVHLSYGDYLQLAQQGTLPQLLSKLKIDAENQGSPHLQLREIHQTLHGNARALEFFTAAISDLDIKESSDLLQALQQAKAESQVDMALDAVIQQRSEAQQNLLNTMRAYLTPVPKEGIIKLALLDKDESPTNSSNNTDTVHYEQIIENLNELVNVSLIEKSMDYQLELPVYQCSPLVVDWLNQPKPSGFSPRPPAPKSLKAAADYQFYLFDKDQNPTLRQAIISHQAYLQAGEIETAHQLVLNWIIGPLNRAGKFQLILEQWLPELCQSESKQIKSEALGQTGKQYHHLGDYETALKFLQQSLKIQQDIGDKYGEGTTLNNISQIYDARGDYDTALKFLQQSLKIQQDIGDKSGEGSTLNNISQIYNARGDYETALKYLQQCLTIFKEIGNKVHEGGTLNNISQIYDARGDYDTALKFLQQSLKIQQDIGDKYGEGTTLNNISQIFKARGDYETALKTLQQSLKIQQDIGDNAGMCATLFNMGHIHAQNEEIGEAFSAWLAVYKMAKEMNLAQALEALASLAPQLGMPEGLDGWEVLLVKSMQTEESE